jgi:hypothetical protein
MIYLYGIREINRLNEERRTRSLAEYERARQTPRPAFVWPDLTIAEADVIELDFGAQCETDRIGA